MKIQPSRLVQAGAVLLLALMTLLADGAEARRSGHQWFIAVINGGEAKDLHLKLDFLGKGAWRSVLLRDSHDKPDVFNRQDVTVRSLPLLSTFIFSLVAALSPGCDSRW